MASRARLSNHDRTHLNFLRVQIRSRIGDRQEWIRLAAGEVTKLRFDGITLTELAEALGTTPSTVRRWCGWAATEATAKPTPPRVAPPAKAPYVPTPSPQPPTQVPPPASSLRSEHRDLLREESTLPAFGPRDSPSTAGSLGQVSMAPTLVALSGAAGENRRFDLEMHCLRRIFGAIGSPPIEKVAIELIEIPEILNWVKPDILHLVAHVDDVGLWIVDHGTDQVVAWDLLFEQFDRVGSMPRLVTLSCCNSAGAAEAISSRYDVSAIGCSGVIPVDSSRMFVETLYERWLRRGRLDTGTSLHGAFDDARARVRTQHMNPAWAHELFPIGSS